MRRGCLSLLLACVGCFSSSSGGPGADAARSDDATDAAPALDAPEAATPDATLDVASESSSPDATTGTPEADAGTTDAPIPEASAATDSPNDAVESGTDAPPDAYRAGSPIPACASLDGGGGASCCAAGSGLSNCGASGTESCCTSLPVPGGTFFRTYANAGGGPTGEADPATLSPFRLDKYAVTVGRFRAFVNAALPADGGAGWLPLAGSGKHVHLNAGSGLVDVGASGTADAGVAYEPGWLPSDSVQVAPTNQNLACSGGQYDTWTDTPGAQENLPINCLNSWEAQAFCIWDGAFLPSEAEYEFAAAGGSDQREYPWGSTAPGTANQYAIFLCNYPNQANNYMACSDVTNIAPAGTPTLGAGRWGQLDLEGNVVQWTLDWYASYTSPCTDCGDLTAAASRVIAGDQFYDTPADMFPGYRYANPASYRGYNAGFRCARVP
jgi:formylglycine-generating enzyme